GTRLVAVTSNTGVNDHGAIWISTDAGATWTDRTAGIAAMGLQGWSSVASDSAGTNLVAAGSEGIWTSVDGGSTWTDHTPPSSRTLPPPPGLISRPTTLQRAARGRQLPRTPKE